MHEDYSGQGFDQLLDVINKIKHNPDDRRIILSAWNPSDLKLMALPPCHMFAQVCSYIWVSLWNSVCVCVS
jgi:dihydrofolate reductase/thymidylate synthase